MLRNSSSNVLHPKHPRFEPRRWKDKYTMLSHNCHMYALNTISSLWVHHCKANLNVVDGEIQCHRPQIGYFSHMAYENKVLATGSNNRVDKNGFTSRTLGNRFLRDHTDVFKLDPNEECPYGYYRVLLFGRNPVPSKSGGPSRYTGFHFFREDKDRTWSHKDGHKPVEGRVRDVLTLFKREKLGADAIAGYFAVPVDEYVYVKRNISDSLNR